MNEKDNNQHKQTESDYAYRYARDHSTCRCAKMRQGCIAGCDKNQRCDFRDMYNAVLNGIAYNAEPEKRPAMSEMIMQGWLARDENGELWLNLAEKPEKGKRFWFVQFCDYWKKMDPNQFCTVKWRDEEPTEVEITIKIKEQ